MKLKFDAIVKSVVGLTFLGCSLTANATQFITNSGRLSDAVFSAVQEQYLREEMELTRFRGRVEAFGT